MTATKPKPAYDPALHHLELERFQAIGKFHRMREVAVRAVCGGCRKTTYHGMSSVCVRCPSYPTLAAMTRRYQDDMLRACHRINKYQEAHP